MTIAGATDGAVFGAFLERGLLPALQRAKPEALIVMDNLCAHRTRAVRNLLEHAGFAYHDLPPYAPDCNLIELVRAPVKAQLRTAAARSIAALHNAAAPPSPLSPRTRPRPPSATPAMPAESQPARDAL